MQLVEVKYYEGSIIEIHIIAADSKLERIRHAVHSARNSRRAKVSILSNGLQTYFVWQIRQQTAFSAHFTVFVIRKKEMSSSMISARDVILKRV